ncbi:MAG: M67 family metallopeptidase [Coriobacteriales bacterium]|nr:M67 family metallopeptidase [Coriobacteriales bacterium]
MTHALLEQLHAQANADAPLETCGILAGTDGEVSALYPVRNAAASATYYSIDPAEQFATYTTIRESGAEVIGVYHSHPASPARPSATDIADAHDPEALYLIISLLGEPTVRAWRIAEGVTDEVTIEPTEG